MRVTRCELAVRIDPWAKANLEARGRVRLVNGSQSCAEFALYLHPDLTVTGFDCPGATLSEPDGSHPLEYDGRRLLLRFEPELAPGATVMADSAWSGRLRGIIRGYCMIADHLVELRDFACWYPLPGGDVQGFTWNWNSTSGRADTPCRRPMSATDGSWNGGTREAGSGAGGRAGGRSSGAASQPAGAASRHVASVYHAFMSGDHAQRALEEMFDGLVFLTEAIGPNDKVEGEERALHLVFTPRYAEGGYVYGSLMTMSEPQSPYLFNYPESRRGWPNYGVAHELAHWWWREQVSVDRTTWHDWLMEALAEYWAVRTDERFVGPGAGVAIYAGYRGRVAAIRDPEPISGTLFTSPNLRNLWYVKGAWILRTLQSLLGEDVFGRAETADFAAACERAAGEDLGWFFEQWLERGELPQLALSWTQAGERLEVAVRQDVAAGPCFRLAPRCASASAGPAPRGPGTSPRRRAVGSGCSWTPGRIGLSYGWNPAPWSPESSSTPGRPVSSPGWTRAPRRWTYSAAGNPRSRAAFPPRILAFVSSGRGRSRMPWRLP